MTGLVETVDEAGRVAMLRSGQTLRGLVPAGLAIWKPMIEIATTLVGVEHRLRA